MGQYPAQGYSGYGGVSGGGYGAGPMDSHTGMQGYMPGYEAGPHAGGYPGQTMPSAYPGGDYSNVGAPQNQAKPTTGGAGDTSKN